MPAMRTDPPGSSFDSEAVVWLERVARQVEAERLLLARQPLMLRPLAGGRAARRRRLRRWGREQQLLAAATVFARLLRVAQRRLDPSEVGRARPTEAVERARLHQCLERGLVEHVGLEAFAQIVETLERTAALAFLGDRIGGARTDALHGAEAVADRPALLRLLDAEVAL
jgi:hypothetical protein